MQCPRSLTNTAAAHPQSSSAENANIKTIKTTTKPYLIILFQIKSLLTKCFCIFKFHVCEEGYQVVIGLKEAKTRLREINMDFTFLTRGSVVKEGKTLYKDATEKKKRYVLKVR